MDPLSLTAAVCSLTAFAGKTVALLTDTGSAFKTSSDDYTRLLKETEVFHILLQHVGQLVGNDGARTSTALSAVLKAITPCESTLAEIQARIGQHAHSGSSFARLRRRIKFVVSRKSFQDLRAELVSHRCSLTIALQLHSIDLGIALASQGTMEKGDPSSTARTASVPRSDGLPSASASIISESSPAPNDPPITVPAPGFEPPSHASSSRRATFPLATQDAVSSLRARTNRPGPRPTMTNGAFHLSVSCVGGAAV